MATTPGGRVQLLDADAELGIDLDPHAFAEARAVTAPVQGHQPGSRHLVDPEQRSAVCVLVVEGLVSRDVVLADRTAVQLIGPGDVVDPWAPPAVLLAPEVVWTVHERTVAVTVDDRTLAHLRRWPTITLRLFERVAQHAARLAVHQAISQLSRVELRVLALMWHLADRWGRIGTEGVLLPLAITHETIGRLVGARRPTVSLALKELAADGCLTRRADGAWLLDRASLSLLGVSPDAHPAWRPSQVAGVRSYGGPPAPAASESMGEMIQRVRSQTAALRDTYEEWQARTASTVARAQASRERAIAARASRLRPAPSGRPRR